jgi:hypothetical protein
MEPVGKELGTFSGTVSNQTFNEDGSVPAHLEIPDVGPFGALSSTCTFEAPENPDHETGVYRERGYSLTQDGNPVRYRCPGVWRETTPGGNWEVKHCAANIDGHRVFVVANFKAADMSITGTQYELES